MTLRRVFRCQAVGGSTQKPTSAAKKQQALEMANLLSKMIQFAPSVVLETTMTLFNDAFDEMTLPKDWANRIQEEATMALQKGRTDVAGGAGDGPASDTGAGAGAGAGVGSPGAQSADMPPTDDIAGAIDALPPQAKIALGNALARGVPIAEAVPEVLRAVAQTQSGE
jgi:hypothetical protein